MMKARWCRGMFNSQDNIVLLSGTKIQPEGGGRGEQGVGRRGGRRREKGKRRE